MSSFKKIGKLLCEDYPKTADPEQWEDLIKLLNLLKVDDFSSLLKKVKDLQKPLKFEKKYRLIREDYDTLLKNYRILEDPELLSKYENLKTNSSNLTTENEKLYQTNAELSEQNESLQTTNEINLQIITNQKIQLKVANDKIETQNKKISDNRVFVEETNRYKRLYKKFERKNTELVHEVKKAKIELKDFSNQSTKTKMINSLNGRIYQLEKEKEEAQTVMSKRQFLFELFQKKANDCKCQYWSAKANELQNKVNELQQKMKSNNCV